MCSSCGEGKGRDDSHAHGCLSRRETAHARRSVRYNQTELDLLTFDGPTPDAASLMRQWHSLADEAFEVIRALPGEEAGTCVMNTSGELALDSAKDLPEAIAQGKLVFHRGTIRGSWPTLRAL